MLRDFGDAVALSVIELGNIKVKNQFLFKLTCFIHTYDRNFNKVIVISIFLYFKFTFYKMFLNLLTTGHIIL